MSNNCNEIASILLRKGTDQQMREKDSLDPDSLKLQDFGLEQWMQFAYNFAKDVNYFSTSDSVTPNGDWQAFFKDNAELKKLLPTYQSSNQLTPHLTLFFCFLHLLSDTHKRFNQLTKRHLDFYYKEVLRIELLPEVNDKAHILFELAKNIERTTIAEGTEFKGGKDNDGKTRVYELTEDFYANKAQVASLRSVYNTPERTNAQPYPVKCAPVANSYNGDGEEFPGTDHSWYGFGYNHNIASNPELPDASLGFAIASNTLLLSEGTRYVVVQTVLNGAATELTTAQILPNVSVYYTGEKGWEGPFTLSDEAINILGTLDNDEPGDTSYQTGLTATKLTLALKLDAGSAPAVTYNKSIHGLEYATEQPVFRFILKTGTTEGYQLYSACTSPISKVDIKVAVNGMRNLSLENDTGNLNAAKPFYPFTTNPVRGARLSVHKDELFSKKWKHAKVVISWKNTPDSFNDLYRAYDKTFEESVAKDWFETITAETDKATFPKEGKTYIPPLEMRGYYSKYNSIVYGDAYFKATALLQKNNKWQAASDVQPVTLFQKQPNDPELPVLFETHVTIPYSAECDNSTGIGLLLNQSFLQELYPRIYALAMLDDSPDVLIPNQPYLPFADYLELNYTAEASIQVNSASLPAVHHDVLFHEHPFGQAEELLALKKQFNPTLSQVSLAPFYSLGGELYLGISDVQQLQQVSLLIQVKEGSENTGIASFENGQKVSWSVLCSNFWKPIEDASLLLLNQTDNFLKSGMVRLVIPKEATNTNSLLPPGYVWIRAKMDKRFDVVCKLLSIDAQAAVAEFDNRGNELSHLEKGIAAGTISKLVNRSALVKGVRQPYNSFGGHPAETDLEYYRRVSERLRHKNRAITLWDYEHIVLQEFPEIFQVKCLNHTCNDSFISAGRVTLVVIPDTEEKNVFDPFQPRVSTALLNTISDHLNSLNSLHVTAKVKNPDYEVVQASLKVKFYDGLDIPTHIQKLNEDIIRYLSPWAYEKTKALRFGVTVYRSQLIHYIEQLDYVDYLQDVRLIKNGTESLKNCTPSTPGSILVSAKEHDITTDIAICPEDGSSNQNSEVCQC